MKKSMYLLLAAIIMLPGVYIQGELINFVDIFVPAFFVIQLLQNGRIKITKRLVPLAMYVSICFMSIVIACIYDGVFYTRAVLKWIRLLEILLIPIIASNSSKAILMKKKEIISCTLSFGIVSGLVGIILFLIQSTLYMAPQTFIVNGRLLHRAGGVFAEPATFSFMMVLIIIVAVQCLFNRMNIFKALLAVIISSICVVISDTRAAILAIAVCAIYIIISSNLFTKRRIIILCSFILIAIFAFSSNNYLKDFWQRRVVKSFEFIIKLDFTSLNSASSGRLEVWKSRIENYCKFPFIQLIFGKGYKCGEIFAGSDNSFISSLYFTGAAGLIAFVNYYWGIVCIAFRNISDKMMTIIFRSFVITMTVCMLLTDGMTLYRPMCLVMLFAEIYSKEIEFEKARRLC